MDGTSDIEEYDTDKSSRARTTSSSSSSYYTSDSDDNEATFTATKVRELDTYEAVRNRNIMSADTDDETAIAPAVVDDELEAAVAFIETADIKRVVDRQTRRETESKRRRREQKQFELAHHNMNTLIGTYSDGDPSHDVERERQAADAERERQDELARQREQTEIDVVRDDKRERQLYKEARARIRDERKRDDAPVDERTREMNLDAVMSDVARGAFDKRKHEMTDDEDEQPVRKRRPRQNDSDVPPEGEILSEPSAPTEPTTRKRKRVKKSKSKREPSGKRRRTSAAKKHGSLTWHRLESGIINGAELHPNLRALLPMLETLNREFEYMVTHHVLTGCKRSSPMSDTSPVISTLTRPVRANTVLQQAKNSAMIRGKSYDMATRYKDQSNGLVHLMVDKCVTQCYTKLSWRYNFVVDPASLAANICLPPILSDTGDWAAYSAANGLSDDYKTAYLIISQYYNRAVVDMAMSVFNVYRGTVTEHEVVDEYLRGYDYDLRALILVEQAILEDADARIAEERTTSFVTKAQRAAIRVVNGFENLVRAVGHGNNETIVKMLVDLGVLPPGIPWTFVEQRPDMTATPADLGFDTHEMIRRLVYLEAPKNQYALVDVICNSSQPTQRHEFHPIDDQMSPYVEKTELDFDE